MPMPPYPILCYTQGCGQLAQYKIAACWSDGVTQELKTYALTCAACLAESLRRSREKQAACRIDDLRHRLVGQAGIHQGPL